MDDIGTQQPEGQPYGRPYTPGMAERRIISAQKAREGFSDLLDRVRDGEHQVITRRSSIGEAIVIDRDFYRHALELMGRPVPDWALPAEGSDPR